MSSEMGLQIDERNVFKTLNDQNSVNAATAL